MKKYSILFLLICLSALAILFGDGKDRFVSIENDKFMLENEEFYPVTLNYCVSLQTDGEKLWACPSSTYNTASPYPNFTEKSSLEKLKADMLLIKAMGFNTVRICRVGEPKLNKNKKGELSIRSHIVNGKDSSIILSKNRESYNQYFNALDGMFEVINEAGLKVIFLIRMNVDYKSTETHLVKISERFKDEPTLMAYDLFNEPLYSNLDLSKEDVYNTVKEWNRLLKHEAPYQLSTIGLEGLGEVFIWDPNILDLDFISYHPYEYEKNQVVNEIYWYGKHTNKPWILGETAIPADNKGFSYRDQVLFAEKTLKQTRACGGAGYSWWQFKDVNEIKFSHSFMGLVTQKEKVKPVASAFINYNPYSSKKDSCNCSENYYNLTPLDSFKLIGHLVNKNGIPIEDGLIIAWDDNWSHSFKAISKPDGSFELTSSFPFSHWMVSATGMTMVRDDLEAGLTEIGQDSIPYVNLGKIELTHLPFLN